jgi:hypothetical protein
MLLISQIYYFHFENYFNTIVCFRNHIHFILYICIYYSKKGSVCFARLPMGLMTPKKMLIVPVLYQQFQNINRRK